MFGAWQVSQYWLLDEWRCCVFLQVRRVERVTETRRKFCLWLASGLSHCCTWRDNVCMPRHPLSAGVLGNMGEGCRPLPRIAAPHETARQKDTVAQWSQARQHYPAALKFKVNQYEPPTKIQIKPAVRQLQTAAPCAGARQSWLPAPGGVAR
jgi:hypothetical protein